MLFILLEGFLKRPLAHRASVLWCGLAVPHVSAELGVSSLACLRVLTRVYTARYWSSASSGMLVWEQVDVACHLIPVNRGAFKIPSQCSLYVNLKISHPVLPSDAVDFACRTLLSSEPSHRPVTMSQVQHVIGTPCSALKPCVLVARTTCHVNLTCRCFKAVRPSPDSRNSQRPFSTQTVYCCGPAARCSLPCGTARAFHADHTEKHLTSFVGQSSAGHGSASCLPCTISLALVKTMQAISASALSIVSSKFGVCMGHCSGGISGIRLLFAVA
jgi:hypothetical protein